MDKDLYIEFLKSEIRRIRAGGNQLYGMLSACPCPDRDKCDSCGRTQEVQDLKMENDRLKKREEILMRFLYSCRCDLECKNCMFLTEANYCAFPINAEGMHWKLIQCAIDTMKKLEDL